MQKQLQEVIQKIARACQRVGRDPKEVTLIAVSKTKPAEMVEEAYRLGVRDFGENKVQEISSKVPGAAARYPLAYDRAFANQQNPYTSWENGDDPFGGFCSFS